MDDPMTMKSKAAQMLGLGQGGRGGARGRYQEDRTLDGSRRSSRFKQAVEGDEDDSISEDEGQYDPAADQRRQGDSAKQTPLFGIGDEEDQ